MSKRSRSQSSERMVVVSWHTGSTCVWIRLSSFQVNTSDSLGLATSCAAAAVRVAVRGCDCGLPGTGGREAAGPCELPATRNARLRWSDGVRRDGATG
jgi:hypothetical protein